jgi:hypothetical protein
MALQTFEVGGEVLGVRQVPSFFRSELHGGMRPTYSYCYFCPHCGEVWGRLRTEGATYWQCCYRNCEAHGDGRLAQHWTRGDEPTRLASDWPRAALLREMYREMEMADG